MLIEETILSAIKCPNHGQQWAVTNHQDAGLTSFILVQTSISLLFCSKNLIDTYQGRRAFVIIELRQPDKAAKIPADMNVIDLAVLSSAIITVEGGQH